jgi:phosphoenolpyruvate---glycerone phosphotransferase subunit DhaL
LNLAVNSVSTSEVLQILDEITSEISRNRDYLTELDSQGGDGDHGVNLERGFLKVRNQLPQLRTSPDIGSILTTVGATLLSTVGGATGSLYGAALMKAGSVCRGKTQIRTSDLIEIQTTCISTLTELGGAKAGDKTMLDVLLPVADTISQAVKESNDLAYVSAQAAKAARVGLETTKTMIAKKGRASYLGGRTLGQYDVGAASMCLMIESCAKTVSLFEKSP